MTCSTSEQLHPPQGNGQQHPHFFSKVSVKSSYGWYIVSNQAAKKSYPFPSRLLRSYSEIQVHQPSSQQNRVGKLWEGQTNQILDLIWFCCCFENSVWVPFVMFLGEFLKLLLFDSVFRNVNCEMWHSVPDRPLFVIASPLLCIVMQWCDTLLQLNTSWQNCYL